MVVSPYFEVWSLQRIHQTYHFLEQSEITEKSLHY
jgi:hypothetical protein